VTAAEVSVTVNGAPMRVAGGASVADLLERLGVANPRVAVERNKEIVPRAQHASTRLAEGDVLEVVELVGGG
jgi:thiamine biosynthesis protein ThiS